MFDDLFPKMSDRLWYSHHNENNGVGVSTVFAYDIDMYETAIIDKNGVHPVQRYKELDKAHKGHDRWVKKAKKITEITKLGLPFLKLAKEIIILERIVFTESKKLQFSYGGWISTCYKVEKITQELYEEKEREINNV